MSRRNWTTKDVVERPCRKCGRILEFWKDDVKVRCPRCAESTFNPNLGNICLSWCEKAVECLGNMDIEEWKKQNESCPTPTPHAKRKR